VRARAPERSLGLACLRRPPAKRGIFRWAMEQEAFSCPICYVDEVPEDDQLVLPECGHRFCALCLIAWAAVRPTCPLCKGAFEAALVRRLLDGTPLAPGRWQLEPLSLLRRAPWLVQRYGLAAHGGYAGCRGDALTSSASASASAATASWFAAEAPGATSAAATAAAAIGVAVNDDEDDGEEAREQAFWEQEAYEAELQANRFLFGNRRFGAGGYIRGERLYGRPVRPHRRMGRKQRSVS
jgi:hypothetical protein